MTPAWSAHTHTEGHTRTLKYTHTHTHTHTHRMTIPKKSYESPDRYAPYRLVDSRDCMYDLEGLIGEWVHLEGLTGEWVLLEGLNREWVHVRGWVRVT